jgi:hypothetical protein
VHQKGTGRIYRITHQNCETVKDLNLAKLSDTGLVDLLKHKNDWYVDHARRLLQERAQGSQPSKSKTPGLLRKVFLDSGSNPVHRLRSMLALHAMHGIDQETLLKLMADKDETIRGWAIQCALEDEKASKPILDQLVKMAKGDDSQFVRLYLASALQRIPPGQRWTLAETLVTHEADKDDHNLPLLYWYGIEPLVPTDKARALKLAAKAKIPLIRQYIARRSTSK